MEDATGAKAAPQATPFWEKVVGAAGLLLVLAVVGFLLYEALQPQTAAEIVAEVKAVTPQAGGYLVDFVASNHGRQTAASVTIEGALYDPATGDEPVETAEVTLDYIPDQSERTGSFVFAHAPPVHSAAAGQGLHGPIAGQASGKTPSSRKPPPEVGPSFRKG